VKNLTEYGAFIDLGGIDGLLHVSDISFGRVVHPSEVLNVGEQITVKILKFDRDKERISLGMKQLAPDPWLAATEHYVQGTRVVGRVVSVTDYGAFVELEAGVEG
jgi:small subunit ribosomal protein S1